PLSETNDAFQTDKRNILFAILGIVMGVFLTGFCVVAPVRNWLDARDWVTTSAVIDRSELTSHSGIHGPEYSLEVKFSYEFAGRKWQSTRRSFNQSIDESVADLDAWVAAHKPGSTAQAFVNPHDPAEAALDRT